MARFRNRMRSDRSGWSIQLAALIYQISRNSSPHYHFIERDRRKSSFHQSALVAAIVR